jgi:hypothetical protein
MAVLIDELESTVEPEAHREPVRGSSNGREMKPKPWARQQIAAELEAIIRRQARLRAD